MSWIQRIHNTKCASYGWQARVPVPGQPRRYLSRFFADKAHGGEFAAYALAEQALPKLRRMARRSRR